MLFLKALLLSTYSAWSFVLIDPNYKLANPTNTTVNIASGGCQANGMSNDELAWAIQVSIDRFWNTVTESQLRLKLGSEVNRSINGNAESGEILVGCLPLGASGPSGYADPNIELGSSLIVLNGTTFVPGGYYPTGLVGTLAHEMGHAIGLGHSADPASLMTYEDNEWGPQANYLSQDDKDGVIYLYPRKPVLGGLLGGCSAVAKSKINNMNSNENMNTNVWLNALYEILIWIGIIYCVRQYRKFKKFT